MTSQSGRRVRIQRIANFLAYALVLCACSSQVVLSDATPSPDGKLTAAVVVRIDAGSPERDHHVYFGIGDQDDNPATKYLRDERTYRLAGTLDWRVQWKSSDRVVLDIIEYPDGTTFTHAQKSPGAKAIATLVYVRKPSTEMFEVIR